MFTLFLPGPYLDSLQLSGKVVLAQTGTSDSTLIVVLHTDLTDSAVVNKRPRYVTRLDSSGNFTFRNLPPDTFAIYAIGDAGISRRYTSSSQQFAFAPQPIITGETQPLTLYAYQEEKETVNKPVTPSKTTATDKRLKFSTGIAGKQQDLQNPFTLTFESPLRTFDTSKMILTTDSTFTPVAAATPTLDSTRKRIAFNIPWKEATEYNLVIDKEFAEDTLGNRLLKSDTISFVTKAKADYGQVSLRVRNIDTAQNPVLQFIQNNNVVFSANVKSGAFSKDLFPPGEYNLRILYDTNNNGIWDPGVFFGPDKKQPEVAYPVLRNINVKPNWENEFEVTL